MTGVFSLFFFGVVDLTSGNMLIDFMLSLPLYEAVI